jgi:hypothetical protein
MRTLLAVLCLTATGVTMAQNRSQIWFGAAVKRELSKDIIGSAGTNVRMLTDGRLRTLYQELSVKSEHLDWFRPSVEYRFVTSYDELGNYTNAHRYNVNFDFRTKYEDFKFGTRLRYQGYIGSGTGSGSDLDPSYRIKPYVEWSNKSRYTPELSAEWFYDPIPGPVGNRFNRFRAGLTLNFNAPGNNDISLTYYYGRKYNTGKPYQEHIVSLEYSFDWKGKKKKSDAEE